MSVNGGGRSKTTLPEGDLVVLLTDVGNELNWFSPSMKIICSDFQLGIFGSSDLA
jgi:hypothetical protein